MKKQNRRKRTALFTTAFFAAMVVLAVGGFYLYRELRGDAYIDSFEACAAAGNPIMESYPEQCSANGKTFMNTTPTNERFKECVAAGHPVTENPFPVCHFDENTSVSEGEHSLD